MYLRTKYLVYVIINLGGGITGEDTVFYDGVRTSDLGSREHFLKHLHGRKIFGPFETKIHEGTLWRGHRAVIYFILAKQIFLYFCLHRDWFYKWYINTTDKKRIFIMMVLG